MLTGFNERPGNEFRSQSFATPSMRGYQASCSQDGGDRTRKEDTANNCSKQDFISISLLVLWHGHSRIVRDLFKPLHLDDMVRYRTIVHA